jgi:hypothetical protein
MTISNSHDSVRKPDFTMKVRRIVTNAEKQDVIYTGEQALRLHNILAQMLARAWEKRTDQTLLLRDGKGNRVTYTLDAATLPEPPPAGEDDIDPPSADSADLVQCPECDGVKLRRKVSKAKPYILFGQLRLAELHHYTCATCGHQFVMAGNLTTFGKRV